MQRSTEQLTRCSTVTLEEISENTEGVPATRTVSEKIMSVCKNTIRWVFLLDVFLILTVIVVLSILEFGTFPLPQYGFYCNDPKIAFKFGGDTVTITLLIVGTIVLPIAVIYATEYACYSTDSYDTVLGCAGSRMKQIWLWYGQYWTRIITLTCVCEVIKIIIGEPRPHFLDTCKPREAENCTTEYVTPYTCTNTIDSGWFIKDSSRSFPSGHSALSMYTTVFIVWYLQHRLSKRTIILKPWLQCLVCMWAVTCSMTRISDNRHHWWDVFAGDILGLGFAMLTVTVECQNFCPGKNLSKGRNERVEIGQVNFNDRKHQSVKKLLSEPSIDLPEGRELKSISTPWKERVSN